MKLALGLLLVATNALAAEHIVSSSKVAMGTQVSISVYTDDDDGAHRAIDNALDEITRIEDLMTTWRPSEVTRLNDNAGKAPVKVSKETMEVLQMSLKAAAWSNGAFDVTFEALHGLWKFDEDLEKKLPDMDAVRERLKLVDWHQLVLDPKQHTAFLKKPGMKVSLGGIAKGYAVDRMAAILARAGFKNALVQAGGDLLCAGTKAGQPWTAGIRDPRGTASDYFAVLKLEDHAFSTAGDYERFYMLDGKRWHHIIDLSTGMPARASRSVTVYAKTALLADAVDDAIFIMGWKRGFQMIESIPDVGAVVVDDKGEVHVSPRMQDRIKVLYTPKNEP